MSSQANNGIIYLTKSIYATQKYVFGNGTHRQTDIADNTLTQPWGRVSKNYETELQSCFSHVKIVSLHILLSRLCYTVMYGK